MIFDVVTPLSLSIVESTCLDGGCLYLVQLYSLYCIDYNEGFDHRYALGVKGQGLVIWLKTYVIQRVRRISLSSIDELCSYLAQWLLMMFRWQQGFSDRRYDIGVKVQSQTTYGSYRAVLLHFSMEGVHIWCSDCFWSSYDNEGFRWSL